MTCQTCTHWNLKANPSMAKVGMATCNLLKNKWQYWPPTHTCTRHKEAESTIVQAREAYLGKL